MSSMTFNQYILATFPVLSSLWKKRYSCVSTIPSRRVLSDAVARMIDMGMWEETIECYRLTYAYATLSSYWAVIILGTTMSRDSHVVSNAQSMVRESDDIFKLSEKNLPTTSLEKPVNQKEPS